MRKKIKFLALTFFLIALATPSSAENRGRAVTLSPFVGGYKFECFQQLDENWYYGLRLGYNFTPHWGLEGFGGYVATESDAPGYDGENVDVYRYGADMLYNFMPDKRFVPFLAAGFGGTQILDPSGLNDKDRAILDYGVGFKFFLTKSIALRADVRHDLLCEFNNVCSNLEYTGGLFILFGGKAKPAVAEAAPPPPPPPPVEEAAPPPPPAAPIVVARPKPKIILIEFDDTHFAHDSSALTPEGKKIIIENAYILNANPDVNILIAGYASASGTDEYNQKLSERRATVVRDALIEGGIAPNRLQKIGYGEGRPAEYEPYIGDIESKAAKANRRVLFTIVVKEARK